MASDELRVGILGAGRIGQTHARNLARHDLGARAVAIADLDPALAARVAKECRIPQVAPEPGALLAAADVDAVLICTPTSTHSEIIARAAEAGKHVFCEKPIDLTLDGVDRALEAVERAGVKLQVGFNRRFDANAMRVRQAIEGGEIGAPHLLRIISRDPSPPPYAYVRESGGLFLDMTIHDLDMARYLLVDEVVEVYATGSVLIDAHLSELGDVDTAVVLLRHAGGAITSIDNSRRATYGYDQRLEVHGAKGAIQTENHYPNAATISDAAGVRRDRPLPFFGERYAESYVRELEAFVEAVRNDAPVPVSGEDGRMATVLALAAARSHALRQPISVREVEG